MKFGLEEQVIENIVSVLEQHPKVDKAFVFGSRAKGNYRPDSDIDIAIKGYEITTDDIIAISVDIETIGVTYKFDLIDYNSIKEPALKEHIDRVGIEFYSRWHNLKLGEVITFQRGHDLTKTDMGIGNYPVAGSNGIIGYHNIFTTKGPGVTIGRSGNIGTPHYYENDFWAHNTVLYIKDFKSSDPKFIYYFLKTIDFTQFNAGSSVPTLNRNHIHELDILLPPHCEQTAISNILSSLDDKIDLLHRQNKTLEQLAETLFRQWFVEEAEDSWEEKTIGEVTEIKAGGDKPKIYSETKTELCNIPIYSNGINKYGLYGYTDLARIKNECITISARGTIGFVCLRQEPFVPIVRLISIIPNENYLSSKFLYLWAKSQNISGTGTTQEQLTVPEFSRTTIMLPPYEKMKKFTNYVNSLFVKLEFNKAQIHTLTQTRYTLLPKLMSGEVRVEYR